MADASNSPMHGLDLPCPACKLPMQIEALHCEACDLRVEGHFRGNEFAHLPADQLQLLRVFVLCEGSIRDMEKALGVSYPTVKSRLAALRATLGLQAAGEIKPENDSAADVLAALERGEIDASAAIKAIKGNARRA